MKPHRTRILLPLAALGLLLPIACSDGDTSRFTHDDGLIVEILRPGSGPEIQAGQTAVVHYTGWIAGRYWKKGDQFDSSHDRGQTFPVRNVGSAAVIKGWNQGIPPRGNVPGMKVGELRRLMIPTELGYGSRGAPGAIPPNADLIFDVELLEIR